MESVTPELLNYIENNIIPVYSKNEFGHGIEHVRYVIGRSFELIDGLDVDSNMVYVVAAYHDIGHHIDAKNHEAESAAIMARDDNFKKFFDNEQLITIKQAIEDHRSSSRNHPRSIYGQIIVSADKNTSIEQSIGRAYSYSVSHNPRFSADEHYVETLRHIINKFGKSGYGKSYINDEKYLNFLADIQDIIEDESKFVAKYKDVVSNLDL